MSSLRDETTWRTLTDCEAACRRWCAECLRASAFAVTADRAPSWRESVLDASYVATAAARALARRTEHDWGSLLMLLGVCEQIAGQAVTRWRRIDDARLRDCITSACECAIACAALVRTMVPTVRRTEELAAVDVESLAAARGSPTGEAA